MMIPPTEFTASRATLNPALRTASASTASRASTASICLSVKSFSSIWPIESTSQKSKFSSSAHSSIAAPSAALRNSPRSLSSLSAFHCFGLCDAVSIIPPSAFSKMTAISVVGVEAYPALMTSTPQESNVPQTTCSTISPDMRASLPTTTLYLSPSGLGLLSLSFTQYAYTNFTMSTGVRASPGAPPIVPRIPEMDLMSVIIIWYYNVLSVYRISLNKFQP